MCWEGVGGDETPRHVDQRKQLLKSCIVSLGHNFVLGHRLGVTMVIFTQKSMQQCYGIRDYT